MMADFHDLAAAYVVDALDADERTEYERHLEGCEACQIDVTRLREPVQAMADVLAEGPSPARRQAVLEEIAVTPQIGAAPNVVPLTPRRNRVATWAMGVAAVLLAVAVGTVFLQLRDQGVVESIATAPDAETVVLEGDGIEARFTYSVLEGKGFLVPGSLPNVASERTYQLWLIDSEGPTSAGLFEPKERFVVVSDVVGGVTLGVTVEPAGGSPAPTTDVLLQASLAS